MLTAQSRAGIGSPRPHLAGLSATRAGLRGPGSSRWSEVYAVNRFGLKYTATGSLVTGDAVVVGSGGFTPPGLTFTATGSLVTGDAVVIASGSFQPRYAATGSLVTGRAVVTASGGFSKPVYAATGSLTTGDAVVVASGAFVKPVYSGSGSLVAGDVVVIATGGFSPPVYLASGSLVTGDATVIATGGFQPQFTATGSLVTGDATVTGSGGFSAVVTYTATGSLVTGPVVVRAFGIPAAANVTFDGLDLSKPITFGDLDLSKPVTFGGIDVSKEFTWDIQTMTQTGRNINVNEVDRIITISGMGIDWNASGYTPKLEVTRPDKTTTILTLGVVAGDVNAAKIEGIDGVFTMSGVYVLQPVLTVGSIRKLIGDPFDHTVR
jgi:hypothetical protein